MEKQRIQILDALFPPKCMFCKVSGKGKICPDCEKKLPYITGAGQLAHTPSMGTENLAVFRYEGRVAESVRKIKYTPNKQLVAFFAARLEEAILQHFADIKFDFLAEVPMAAKEVKERGFNHSAVLCKALSVRMGVPVLGGVLKEKDTAKAQHSLDLVMRMENAKSSIDVAKPRDLCGKNILILDDIITTGSTLDRCATLFYGLGAAKVRYAAICRTIKK